MTVYARQTSQIDEAKVNLYHVGFDNLVVECFLRAKKKNIALLVGLQFAESFSYNKIRRKSRWRWIDIDLMFF